jgi:hypothetical protein
MAAYACRVLVIGKVFLMFKLYDTPEFAPENVVSFLSGASGTPVQP